MRPRRPLALRRWRKLDEANDSRHALSVDRISFLDGRYVAVAAVTGNGGADHHETWISDDSVRWTELPGAASGPANYGPGLVAGGRARFVGISATGSEHSSDVWLLRAAETPNAKPTPSPIAGWPTVTAGSAVSAELSDDGPLELLLTGRGIAPGTRLSFDTRVGYDISWFCWRPRRAADPTPYGLIGEPYVGAGRTTGTLIAAVTAVVRADGTVEARIPLTAKAPTCPADYPNLDSSGAHSGPARIVVSPVGVVLATDFLYEFLI